MGPREAGQRLQGLGDALAGGCKLLKPKGCGRSCPGQSPTQSAVDLQPLWRDQDIRRFEFKAWCRRGRHPDVCKDRPAIGCSAAARDEQDADQGHLQHRRDAPSPP